MRTPLSRRPFFSMMDTRGLTASGEGPRRLSRSDQGQGGWTIWEGMRDEEEVRKACQMRLQDNQARAHLQGLFHT